MATDEFSDLSLLTKTVFVAILGSFIGIVVIVVQSLFKKVRDVVWKPHNRSPKTHKTKAPESSSEAQPEVVDPAPKERTVQSYKDVIRGSRINKFKTRDEGKIVEHPLYVFSLKEHKDCVNGFGWARDASAIVSACDDRHIRLFTFPGSIDKGVNTRQIDIQGAPIDCGFLESTNSLVVLYKGVGRLDAASIAIYKSENTASSGTQWTCTKTSEKVFGADAPLRMESVVHSESGKTLIIVCSVKKKATVFAGNGEALSSFDPNSFINHDLAVSFNGALTSVATFTSDAKVWALKFTRDGTYRDSLKVMDLRGHQSKVMTVAFSMDATRAVSVSQDGIMKIWNVAVKYDENEDPRCLRTVKTPLNDGEHYHRLAFGPDMALAAAVNGHIHFFSIKDGKLVEKIDDAHEERITALHWAPRRVKCRKGTVRVLASSGKDRRIRMWAHPHDARKDHPDE